MKELQLNVRLSKEERARLDRVAKHYGLNATSTLRMLLKREFDALSQPALASSPKPR
jgi:antitoxin component of RelBE/YafQ-DinJ toxin-antitoxin module